MLYIYSKDLAFEDITESLIYAFNNTNRLIKRISNIDERLVKKDSKDIVLMLGLNTYNGELPCNYIAYQLEQSKNSDNNNKDENTNGETKSWFNDEYIRRLRNALEIWDYSMQNIMNITNLFKKKGLKMPKIRYVPITYLPIFYTAEIANATNVTKDIDVLFYGSINDRREKIIADLQKADSKLNIYFGGYNLWGKDRDDLIKRSKIVLNIHFYADPILETTRLAPLVSQEAFVISEPSSDRLLDKFWSSMVTFCTYDKIVDKVLSFLKVYDSCHEFAKMARQELQKHPYLDKFNLSPDLEIFLDNDNDNDDEYNDNAIIEERLKKESKNSQKIRKAACKREETEDGGTAEVLELINISDDKLPTVTIVTPTYNRSELLPIALRNFRKTIYPFDKLEWIVLDDSNENHRKKNKELLQGDIRIKYLESDHKLSISEKRNYLAYKSNSEYIVHMDDDDYYYPESVLARIKLLLKYKSEGIKCVGCTEIGIYHLLDNYSYLMDCKNYLSEASMAYHRKFWEERPFPSDKEMEKMSSKTGEGALFLERRLHEVIDMPFIFNFIAVTHKKNVTGKLRTYNLNQDAKLNGTNFFNLWDIDTQLFFIKMARKSA